MPQSPNAKLIAKRRIVDFGAVPVVIAVMATANLDGTAAIVCASGASTAFVLYTMFVYSYAIKQGARIAQRNYLEAEK